MRDHPNSGTADGALVPLVGAVMSGNAVAPSGPEAICEICFRPACTREHRECSPPRKARSGTPRPHSPLTCQRCGLRLRDEAPLCGFCIVELALEIDPAVRLG
jgi:hypothetical protein